MTDRFNPAGNALITEQNRVRRSRATAGRALTRRRWRRRVLPPLAVTSAVMLGTGTAGAWVHAALQTASPAASTDTGSQLAGLDQLRQQLAADQQTLASLTGVAVPQAAGVAASGAATVVSAAPAAVTAGPALAAAPSTKAASGTKATTAKGTASSGKTPTGAATAGGKPATAQTAGQPAPAQAGGGQPTTAPAPAPAPAPTTAAAKPTTPAPAPTTQAPAPAPTVHATTGASGAKP
jgi:hypothetical protein